MKRFIDLGDQILEDHREFAFYCTVVDRFEEFGDHQTFCCLSDFESAWLLSGAGMEGSPHGIERYKRLLASWVMLKCGACV